VYFRYSRKPLIFANVLVIILTTYIP